MMVKRWLVKCTKCTQAGISSHFRWRECISICKCLEGRNIVKSIIMRMSILCSFFLFLSLCVSSIANFLVLFQLHFFSLSLPYSLCIHFPAIGKHTKYIDRTDKSVFVLFFQWLSLNLTLWKTLNALNDIIYLLERVTLSNPSMERIK